MLIKSLISEDALGAQGCQIQLKSSADTPKSIRIQSSCQDLFTLLGSTGTKAAHRMLVKLTLGY